MAKVPSVTFLTKVAAGNVYATENYSPRRGSSSVFKGGETVARAHADAGYIVMPRGVRLWEKSSATLTQKGQDVLAGKVETPANEMPIDHSDRLKPFFDKVCNEQNWKFAIAASVKADVLAETIEAIAYFTGGVTTVKSMQPGEFWITSPGYHNIIGA
jgi:hypothetical protein